MADKLDNIITLAGKFKSQVELKEYCDNQFKLIGDLNRKVARLEEENEHLKQLLQQTVPVIAPLDVTNEQAICELQLERLKRAALDRELTLEETKKMDLLIKNLYLAKGQSTAIINAQYKKVESEISDAQLVDIATTKNE